MAEFGQFLTLLGNGMIVFGTLVFLAAAGTLICVTIAEHLFKSDD